MSMTIAKWHLDLVQSKPLVVEFYELSMLVVQFKFSNDSLKSVKRAFIFLIVRIPKDTVKGDTFCLSMVLFCKSVISFSGLQLSPNYNSHVLRYRQCHDLLLLLQPDQMSIGC